VPPPAATSTGRAEIPLYILKRIMLALITLWILSVIVFLAGQKLPGDPGRAILGPLAQESGVRQLDHKLGVDRPILTQYDDWITHLARGDMGTSYQYQKPIEPLLGNALRNSLKLALVAFIMCVPLSILAGVVAALTYGSWPDRTISVIGLSALGLPEFVSGVFLILIFGIWLNVLPLDATPPPGAGVGTQVYHLIMPAIPITLVLFGYIMRMARAGTIAALDADYTRTAVLKGLPRRTVILRHVLPNSLLPTITVVATQIGYLIGGLVLVEFLFHYQGIGSLTYNAATNKDFPMLEACVLVIGVIYLVATLLADIVYTLLNPRLRLMRE
jgi:peptide/nickel transport system permease protein